MPNFQINQNPHVPAYERASPDQADSHVAPLDLELDSHSTDHWMRRVSIMTLLTGVGAIVCGYNISELDNSLGRQIELGGLWVGVFGTAMWFITHLILKGSEIEAK
jgi:hypothetical protein